MSAKFQGNWIMHLCFILIIEIFAKCVKRRKNQNFGHLYLGMWQLRQVPLI